MSEIPWNLKLKLMKMLTDFMWHWGTGRVFWSGFVLSSTWNDHILINVEHIVTSF